MDTRAKPGRLKRSPADVLQSVGIVVAIVAAIAGTGTILVLRGSEHVFAAGPSRTPAERAAQLASGQCARRPDGTLLGRIVGERGPTRGLPQGEYVIETIDRRGEMEVPLDGVRLVPCASVRR